MIDANDKQTQLFALDEQRAKAKRGRPVTGKAISNADRQRAYRERQKAQRNDNSEAEQQRAIADMQEARYNHAVSEVNKLLIRIQELELQLAQGNEKSDNETIGVWCIEVRRMGKKKWEICGDACTSFVEAKESVDYMQFQSGTGQLDTWRACRADGMMYWPNAPK
ncbi:hypothetical protein [Pseudomonas sp. BN102]|uniref:hypothetical protein n=1 Tax=Pseudomonas sp. BN102 TaxID=2567886 RepID=UPI002456ECA6|nr:hypothetical protein [Pseudomonas sp. BN102]MDH4610311.1 hypothetical protein [Pseudomonas sp. BN102]